MHNGHVGQQALLSSELCLQLPAATRHVYGIGTAIKIHASNAACHQARLTCSLGPSPAHASAASSCQQCRQRVHLQGDLLLRKPKRSRALLAGSAIARAICKACLSPPPAAAPNIGLCKTPSRHRMPSGHPVAYTRCTQRHTMCIKR
jgi:hypothetical protein